MNTKILIIIISIITTISGLSQVKDKGVGIQISDNEITGTRRAVIIGISDYQNIDKLNYAHADAEAFYNYLISKSGGSLDPADIKILINGDATQPKIWEAISWLVQESKEGDQAVFYFSGHGAVENTVVINQGFLLCQETANTNYMSAGVAVYLLQQSLVQMASKKVNVLSIIDACHSGKLSGGIEGVSIIAKTLEEQWSNVNKVLSSQSGELSQESNKWGGGAGIFTFTLIQGLMGLADENKDKKVTLHEIDRYLGDNVSKETSGMQFPVVSGDKKTVIANVDNEVLSDLLKQKSQKSDNYENLFASKGFENKNITDLDNDIKDKIEKIKEYVKADKLIKPKDENAWDLYVEMSKDLRAEPVIQEIRGMLIVALQEKANSIIKYYINCDTARFNISVDDADKQLSHALELMGETHIIYNLVKSKQLFIKGCIEIDVRPDVAMKLLEESIALEPDAAYVLNVMGLIYYYKKDRRKAEEYFFKAAELAPNWAYPYQSLGSVHFETGEYRDAVKFCTKAIELKPDYLDAYNTRGASYSQLEDMQSAYEDMKKCLEIDENEPIIYENIGWICINVGYDSLAAQYFLWAYNIGKEKLSDSQINGICFGLSLAYFRNNQKNDAKKLLEWVVDKIPELSNGMSGLKKFEEFGYGFNSKEKKYIKKMLDYYGYK